MQYDENAEKYGYEGEMMPLKCDKLTAYKGDVTIPVYGTIADADVYLKKDVDAAIAELKEFAEDACIERDDNQTAIDELQAENAELKQTIDELVSAKKSAEQILQNLLDCGLIKEWYFNGKLNAVLKADDPHLQIAELKKKLEDVQASMYADVVDANMENRRLKRALWVTRTAMAKSEKDRWNAHVDCGNRRNRKDPAYVKTGKLLEISEWRKLWADIESKCRAKAEEYK